MSISARNIAAHAEKRREKWLQEHGSHEWEAHNLLEEALEELADAWNYMTAYDPATPEEATSIGMALGNLHWAYEILTSLHEEEKNDTA